MEIKILGAHCLESVNTRLTSMVIDGVLALDAGGLTSGLSFVEQSELKAILLSHQHLDHSKDIAFIGYYNALRLVHDNSESKKVYSIAEVFENLSAHLLNGKIFPDFTSQFPWGTPPLQFCPIQPYEAVNVLGYGVKAIPTKHAVPSVGFAVTSPKGKTLFFTSDTGPDISHCWEHVTPDLLIADVTSINEHSDRMALVGHLTPKLLKDVLVTFLETKGYLPPVVLIHLPPELEEQVRQEVAQVSQELSTDIKLGYEGMVIPL